VCATTDHVGLRVLPKRTRRDGSVFLATSDSASRDKHRGSVGSPGSGVVISGGSARAGKARGGPVAWRLGLVVALTVAMATGAEAATARAREWVACHGDAPAGLSSVKLTGASAPSCSRILTLLRTVSGRVVLGGGRVDGWTCRWVLGQASCTHGQVTVAASYADTANCWSVPSGAVDGVKASTVPRSPVAGLLRHPRTDALHVGALEVLVRLATEGRYELTVVRAGKALVVADDVCNRYVKPAPQVVRKCECRRKLLWVVEHLGVAVGNVLDPNRCVVEPDDLAAHDVERNDLIDRTRLRDDEMRTHLWKLVILDVGDVIRKDGVCRAEARSFRVMPDDQVRINQFVRVNAVMKQGIGAHLCLAVSVERNEATHNRGGRVCESEPVIAGRVRRG
jgi:hypothetical protein